MLPNRSNSQFAIRALGGTRIWHRRTQIASGFARPCRIVIPACRMLVTTTLCWAFALPVIDGSAAWARDTAPREPAKQVVASAESQAPKAGDRKADKRDENDAGQEVAQSKVRKLVTRLDDDRFEERNLATRQLVRLGKRVIPQLVEALDEPSREIRFRSGELLRQHFSFSEVVPHLLNGLERSSDSPARGILVQRAKWQLELICQSASTERMLKFWDTDVATFRLNTLSRIEEAKAGNEMSNAILPLVGLIDKAEHFETTLERLEALGLPHGHQFSSGFLIAQTLARGLKGNDDRAAQFAESYVSAFEELVNKMEAENKKPHLIKKEVIDRANYSRGAASYLVQILNDTTTQRSSLLRHIGFPPERLTAEFLNGLSAADRRQCYRDIGKVHIVDMLTESLSRWSQPADDAVVNQLIAGVQQTVDKGDKPKALAYLDALDARWDQSQKIGRANSQLMDQMCQRLLLAAQEARNNREYHPARATHDQFLLLFELNITPENWAFPGELWSQYLSGQQQASSDKQRLALERYVQILERIAELGIDRESNVVKQFLLQMRESVTGDQERLSAGAAVLRQLAAERSQADAQSSIQAGLELWINSRGQAN
jgi:hypothetical protein